MDTQRIAPSVPSNGPHAQRHRSAQGAADGPGAFSSLLSGLGEPDADVAADAPIAKTFSSQAADPSAGGADPQWAALDGSMLSWVPPASEPRAAGGAKDGVDLSASDSLSIVPRGLQSSSAGLTTSPARSAPSTDPLGFETEHGLSGLSGLAAGRGASMSAGTSLRGKGSTESDTSDSALTKTVGDIAHTRVAGAAGILSNPAEVAQSLLLQRVASAQRIAAGEASANAQAVPISVAPQGISQSAVGLVGQTARMDMVAGVATGEVAASSAKPAVAGRKTVASALSDKAQRFAQVTDLVQRSTAQVDTLGKPGTAKELRAGGEASQLHQVQQKAEAVRANMGDPVLAPSVVVAPFAMAPWVAERRGEGSPSRLAQRDSVGTPSGQAFGEGGASLVDLPGRASMDGAAFSPEEAITEQVTYWLGENLKNAELTIDHAGQPIDVRVSLAGNEAHVAFRSDQAQTRELLDASMGQLRELLRSEGLVLSGMSVDSQEAGQHGEKGGDQSTGREGTVEVPVGAGEPTAPTRRILTDRSVDLFV